MKKVLFLMILPFLMFSRPANLHGQVTIGSDEPPHPGAVLELKSDSRGLLLPRVALKGATDFLGNDGDKAAAAGMLVFNTGYKLDGPGLYVWTGTGWQAVNPINYEECDVPEKPASITFSKTSVPVNTLFTATASLTTSDSYEWTFPDGFEIADGANARIITLKAKRKGTFEASEITVKAVNPCGASEATAGTGTIIVDEPTARPAMSTLTFPSTGTYLEPNDEFTITCSDVGADEYIWTLPDGITPASGTTTTTENSITVIVPEGIYEPYTFKVKAHNSIGDSDERTGSGGRIFAEHCELPPRDIYLAPFREQTYLQDATFTVLLIRAVEGPVSHQWTLPQGLSIVSGNGTMRIIVSCDRPGSYNGSDIRVKIKNECGETTFNGSGTFTVVSNKGVEETINSDTIYTTYKYPNGLGTWMTQNSKEGTPSWDTYPGKTKGERGYYYSYEQALSNGCPEGWAVPTTAQFDALFSYLGSKTAIDEQNEPWLTLDAKAGYYRANKTYGDWDTYLYMKILDNATRLARVSLSSYTASVAANATTGYSVRCIKNSCDEAPKNAVFRRDLNVIATLNGIDTIRVSYRTFGPDTTVTWTSSDDIEIIDSTKTYAVVKFIKAGTFDWSNLSCTVENSCGSVTIAGSGECKVTSSEGIAGSNLICDDKTYRTWIFPDNMGRWMMDWLRGPTATYKTHPMDPEGDKGYYYSFPAALNACPTGWRLPTGQEALQWAQVYSTAWRAGLIPIDPVFGGWYQSTGIAFSPPPATERRNLFWSQAAVIAWSEVLPRGNDNDYAPFVQFGKTPAPADGAFPVTCIETDE